MVIERYEVAPTLQGGEVYELSLGEAEALRAAADSLRGFDPYASNDWYHRAVRRAGRSLGGSVHHRLEDFSRDSGDSGYLVVKGANVGPVPPTPPDNSGAVGRGTLLVRESAVLTGIIGRMDADHAGSLGVLHQDLVPTEVKQPRWVAQGSRVAREADTDHCVTNPKMRPDLVTLACLRGDPYAVTYTFTARQLVSCLTSKEAARLRRPLWIAPFQVCGPAPIIAGPEHDPTLVADPDLLRGISHDAQDLLGKVLSLYQEHHNSYLLQRGDILILDHRRTMYGRSTFRAQLDGGDRFLVRTTATRNLKPPVGGVRRR